MANDRFSLEYEAQFKVLQQVKFQGVAAGVLGLKKVLTKDGPDRAEAGALDNFRTLSLRTNEPERLMESAGLKADGVGVPSEESVKTVALLKFMRHLYMVSDRGNQQVWVLATPDSFRKFPQEELLDVKTSHAQIRTKLVDVKEKFGNETRQRIGEATQLALAWIEAAKLVLSKAKTDSAAMNKVKRWFASSATTADDLNKTIAKVHAGFKTMAGTLNSHRLVITDMPHDRGDTKKQYEEAYVFTATEKPRTVYLEQALFKNYNVSVLHDMRKNWARVIVHEVSHIDAKTKDKAYAHSGIGVGTLISPDEAAVNADTWAFFAADCAGALTDDEISRATGGTHGTLTVMDNKWG